MYKHILFLSIFMLISCKHIKESMFKYEDKCQEDIMKGYLENAEKSCGLCYDYDNSAICANNMGIVSFVKNKDIEKAIDYLNEAISLDKNNIQSYNNLGVIYYNTQQYTKAIKYLDKALEVLPNYYDALYNKALCYKALKNEEQYNIWMNKAEASIEL